MTTPVYVHVRCDTEDRKKRAYLPLKRKITKLRRAEKRAFFLELLLAHVNLFMEDERTSETADHHEVCNTILDLYEVTKKQQ